MTLHVFKHISSPDVRESIRSHGLLPHKPSDSGRWDWVPGIEDQPEGVYVTPVGDRSWWADGQKEVWKFAYIGPLLQDKLIETAFVVPEPIPAESLTLVKR